jgi:flagellar hook assembly protein FlgD
VAVELGGRVRVLVHDQAGALIRTVADTFVDARATPFAWDGRNAHGEIVAPGMYLITASTPKGAGTRKIAVSR